MDATGNQSAEEAPPPQNENTRNPRAWPKRVEYHIQLNCRNQIEKKGNRYKAFEGTISLITSWELGTRRSNISGDSYNPYVT